MKNFAFIFLTLFSFLSFSNLAYGSDIKLECEFTDYSRSSYKERISKSWLPSIQNFTVKGNYVDASYYRLSNGRIEVNNDKRIRWSYKNLKFNNKNGQKRTLKYKFTYFKTNNKIVADIIFTGYRNHTDIMGTCSENISKVSTPLEHDLSDMNEISLCVLAADKGKWSSSNLHSNHIKEAKRRGLTCGVVNTEKEKQKQLERETRIKLKQEKIRSQEIEKENRLKLEQEKIKKKAVEVARKKRLKEEKQRKKKLAEEKAKRDAELKAKKLAEERAKVLKLKIKSIKQKANNFYNDINDFVKSGGDLDLLKLSELYDLKPNPKTKWNKKEVTNYENLENYVRSNIEFNAFEENKIIERKRVFEQKKSEIILSLNNNLDKLNVLFRENFSMKEFSKPIKQDIKKIKDILNNEGKDFIVENGINILNKSSETIVLISNKIKKIKKLDNDLTKFNEDLNLILRDNFGKVKGKSASKLIKKIKNVKTTLEKEELNNQIKTFLKTGKIVEQKVVKSANKNSVKSVKKTSNNKNVKSKPKKDVKKLSKNSKAMNEELKKQFQYYFIVRACHEASQLYISQREFLKAKKYIKATDNFYKSQGINTDKIFKFAEEKPDRTTNATLSLVEISKIGGFNSDTSKSCKLNFMFMKKPEKQKGKKDF